MIQELTWWPPNIPGTFYQSDSVEQILFSFYNGELYKISVTYDHSFHGRAHRGGHGEVHFGEIRPGDKC